MNQKREFTIPRRCYLDKLTPAELAIKKAMYAVEELPPDTRLTQVVMLLEEAFNLVADYTESQNPSGS